MESHPVVMTVTVPQEKAGDVRNLIQGDGWDFLRIAEEKNGTAVVEVLQEAGFFEILEWLARLISDTPQDNQLVQMDGPLPEEQFIGCLSQGRFCGLEILEVKSLLTESGTPAFKVKMRVGREEMAGVLSPVSRASSGREK